MTTYAGVRHLTSFKASKLRYKILSGTVTKSGSGIARRVVAYKNENSELLVGDVMSAVGTGAFSLEVVAGSNDRFRIICIGETDENSEIFESVVEV